MPTSPVPGPSWTIDGYDDFREIGRGGAAVVYSARQIGLDRRVAVKVLNAGLDDDASRRRFERECAVLGVLGDSPGIVAVHSAAFTSDGRGCLVMRLMEGSLADELRRCGPLDPERIRDIGVAVCAALSAAHTRGIVHRDVKPGNLLVSATGEVALGDFDIASAGSLPASTLTNDSLSPPHAPPERLTGDGHGSPAGDVWSLGSTLYTLLGDRQPFGNASDPGGMAGLIQRVLNDPVPPLSRSVVPGELEAVLRRAMNKDPDGRWPDAAAMAQALAAIDIDPALHRSAVDPVADGRVRKHPTGTDRQADQRIAQQIDQRAERAERTDRPAIGASSAATGRPVVPNGSSATRSVGTIVVVALVVAIAVAIALAIAFI